MLRPLPMPTRSLSVCLILSNHWHFLSPFACINNQTKRNEERHRNMNRSQTAHLSFHAVKCWRRAISSIFEIRNSTIVETSCQLPNSRCVHTHTHIHTHHCPDRVFPFLLWKRQWKGSKLYRQKQGAIRWNYSARFGEGEICQPKKRQHKPRKRGLENNLVFSLSISCHHCCHAPYPAEADVEWWWWWFFYCFATEQACYLSVIVLQ